jgi:uncharacterized protein
LEVRLCRTEKKIGGSQQEMGSIKSEQMLTRAERGFTQITTLINNPPPPKPMKTVLLDTNFLMVPAQFKVDIFSEIERICTFAHQLRVMEGTPKELDHIIKKAEPKDQKAAKMALALIKNYKLKAIPMDGMDVDAAILDLPKKDLIVATQDQALKIKLREKGVSILLLRKQKHLQLIE